jgi:HlyD family secretion protein
MLDQRQQQMTSAEAALSATKAQVNQASASIAAADANVGQLKTVLGDATITSPVRGRVVYRLMEPGAVLPAGGRPLTLLDLTNVNMTIFLAADAAGKLAVGGEARVVLDAVPEYVFPTTISFVAADAQFTPKTVETSSEREKLMFRVRLKAPPAMLKTIGDQVKTGLRGMGYVRVDPNAAWPARLAVKLPP